MKSFRIALARFVNKNSTPLTIITALFIAVEGSTLWFHPESWWQPLLALLAGSVIVLLWVNVKVIIRAGLSIALAVMLFTFAVMVGYSYTNSSVGGSLMGLSILMAWMMVITVSYFTASSRSRWMASAIASIMAFAIEYTLLPLRSIVVIVAAGVIAGLLSGLIALKSDWFSVRSRRGLRVDVESDDLGLLDRCRKVMTSLWPDAEFGSFKIQRGRRAWVWFGEHSPTIVLLPITMDEALGTESKRGFTYKHRLIRRSLQWTQSRIELKMPGPYPIPIILDVNKVNTDTVDEPAVITYQMLNSGNVGYYGLVSVPKSNQRFKTMLAACVAKFNGAKPLTHREYKRMHSKMHRSDISLKRTMNDTEVGKSNA
jgi:hypothetical protein